MFNEIVRILTNVRHVLELKKSRISLGMLDSKVFSFKGESRVLHISKDILVVMKGKKSNRIYILERRIVTGTVAISLVTNSNVTKL